VATVEVNARPPGSPAAGAAASPDARVAGAAAPPDARPGGRERLTRDRVLRAALAFVDTHGLAALSMHKLGAELGVKGMSLYSHVDSKDALLDGIVEIMSEEVEAAPAGLSWQDALRAYTRSLRAVMRRHPAAAPLLVSRPVMPASRLECLDSYLQVLLRAGFPEDRALQALRTMYVYAHGHALAEITFTDCAHGTAVAADELAGIRYITQMVPRDVPDRLHRLAVRFCSSCDMDTQFDLGIDLMIGGLEAECPPH
jgi:AcrR family transcriptional regulator